MPEGKPCSQCGEPTTVYKESPLRVICAKCHEPLPDTRLLKSLEQAKTGQHTPRPERSRVPRP